MNVNVPHYKGKKFNHNQAEEREIGELKKRYQHNMLRKKVPKHVWAYGFVHQAEVLSRISIGTTGRTGLEEVTGNTPDISEW